MIHQSIIDNINEVLINTRDTSLEKLLESNRCRTNADIRYAIAHYLLSIGQDHADIEELLGRERTYCYAVRRTPIYDMELYLTLRSRPVSYIHINTIYRRMKAVGIDDYLISKVIEWKD